MPQLLSLLSCITVWSCAVWGCFVVQSGAGTRFMMAFVNRHYSHWIYLWQSLGLFGRRALQVHVWVSCLVIAFINIVTSCPLVHGHSYGNECNLSPTIISPLWLYCILILHTAKISRAIVFILHVIGWFYYLFRWVFFSRYCEMSVK